MKKLLSLLVISLALLSACGSLEGIVAEKTDTSFMLEISAGSSQSGASVEEIHLTDYTVFSGAASSFEELEEGDQVRVAPLDTTPDFPYFLASEIVVE